MGWSNSDIRRLLRHVDTSRLDADPLAQELQRALGTGSAREAVLALIAQSFEPSDDQSALLYKTIALRDLQQNKTRQAARALNLSSRQYFRYRAAAIDRVARAADRILQQQAAEIRSDVKLANLVARFNPKAALQLYQAAEPEPEGKVALRILTTALEATAEVGDDLIRRCKGPWRPLALAAVGRRFITQGAPESSKPWREKVELLLRRSTGRPYDDAAFELAYMDRLEAIRRCDMKAARAALVRMNHFAAHDAALSGLTLVAQVEQACDDMELQRAESLLVQLERWNGASGDFKVLARTIHAQAVYCFVRGQFREALNLASGAAAALVHVEPGFALCAHANAGRAALQLDQAWEPPLQLCERYPAVWITGHIHAVHARHLLRENPAAAAAALERALEIAIGQNAAGALGYARASRAMLNSRLRHDREAVNDATEAWENALQLGRASYQVDLFAHPHVDLRLCLATLADPLFASAAHRRFTALARETAPPESADLPADIAEALDFALQLSALRLRNSRLLRKAQLVQRPSEPVTVAERSLERLAAEIALLMPLRIRRQFGAQLFADLKQGVSDSVSASAVSS